MITATESPAWDSRRVPGSLRSSGRHLLERRGWGKGEGKEDLPCRWRPNVPEAPGSIPPALHKPGMWYTLVIPALGRQKDREIQLGAVDTQEMPSLKEKC